MTRTILLSLFLLLFGGGMQAQNEVIFHAGAAIPLGAFANDDQIIANDGGAKTGFNVGLELKHELEIENLKLFLGVNYLNNTVTDNIKNLFASHLGALPGANINYLYYTNVPVLVGANYSVEMTRFLGLFANAGVGADFLFISDMSFSALGKTNTFASSAKAGFAFKAGVGLLLGSRFQLEAAYYGLGNHRLTQTLTNSLGSVVSESDLQVSALSLTFGLRF